MATQTSVLCHNLAAASHETAAAIKRVHAVLGAGLDPAQAWLVLMERAKTVIDLYDNEDERLEARELAGLRQPGLRTAEDFRLLIESQHIPADDPRARLYDEFADRAELIALAAAEPHMEIRIPPSRSTTSRRLFQCAGESAYTLVFSKTARKRAERLPLDIQHRLVDRLRTLRGIRSTRASQRS